MNIDKAISSKKGTPPRGLEVTEPIAIVGMSCRFPGAANPKEFWKLLRTGKDTITAMPTDRWDISKYYDADRSAADRTNQQHGSFLTDIHDFDPFFFNISPAEAAEMNPSQKLMMELAWEAIESSTIPYEEIKGKKVGVYTGNIWSDFEHYRKHRNAVVTSHSAVGQSANIIANRVSYNFGFRGPSLVVDTGCSSALVALHLGIQSLRDGSVDYCMAGGINHILDQDQYILLTKFGGLSTNGKCSTFDSNADGFVRGEGAGNVLLKRLSDAERDGDRILAVIRGSAVNNNGFNASLPATSVEGQKEVLTEAYKHSGINPKDVHFVEAHGTGTKLGDPTETRALGEFFGENRDRLLRIGSVKTNIGHLEGAAGIAGLIKVILGIQHRQLPQNLNYNTPNPDIAFEELKLKVQNQHEQWPVEKGETLKAGVNSFGWGGTNAHVVVEEYINKESKEQQFLKKEGKPWVLPLSAKSADSLKQYVLAYLKDFIEGTEEDNRTKIVATALNKPVFNYRKTFVADSMDELIAKMRVFSNEETEVEPVRNADNKGKVAFVFPGQGAQWLGMGKELYAGSKVFKSEIDAFDVALSQYTDWSLVEQLHADETTSRMGEINVVQPAICAIQIALAKKWMSWGVVPDAVIGHSMGEVAAAYIAGGINLGEAAKIIATRSGLMKTVSGRHGSMAVTELTIGQAKEIIKDYPNVALAVSNSPKSTVLSGNSADIDIIIAQLEGKGLFAKKVNVDVASHSPQMDELMNPLSAALSEVRPSTETIPMYSTCRDSWVSANNNLTADYWVDNLRNTVNFASAMEQLMTEKYTTFVEVSPHPVLSMAINECLSAQGNQGQIIPSLLRNKPEQEVIHNFMEELLSGGYLLDWKNYYEVHKSPYIDLPSYPFQRDTYEIIARIKHAHTSEGHPLLGGELSLAGSSDVKYWENVISTSSLPYLKGHQVNGSVVLPGCTYFEMALQAACEIEGFGTHKVENLTFVSPIQLQEEGQIALQLKMERINDDVRELTFFSKNLSEENAGWTKTAYAQIVFNASAEYHDFKVEPSEHLSATSQIDSKQYYEELQQLGLQYQNRFQALRFLKRHQGYVEAFVQAEDAEKDSNSQYLMHPAVLDSCFQAMFAEVAALDDGNTMKTTFLSSIEGFQWLRDADLTRGVWVVGTLDDNDSKEQLLTLKADLWLCDADRMPFAKVEGIEAKVIETELMSTTTKIAEDWIYKVNWTAKASKELLTKEARPEGTWLIVGGEHSLTPQLNKKLTDRKVATKIIAPLGADYPHDYTLETNERPAYEKVLQQVRDELDGEPIAGVVHCSSVVSVITDEAMTSKQIKAEQKWGSLSAIHLLNALSSISQEQEPALAFVTNGVQQFENSVKAPNILQAPLWGLAKVVANEFPQYNCQRIDLSWEPTVLEIDRLASQLLYGDKTELEVAFRRKHCYVPRLKQGLDIKVDQAPVAFSKEGTYIVTGYRGLGMEYIKWMFANGARNFALLSRSGKLTEVNCVDIEEMTAQGANFQVMAADVSNFEQLKSSLTEIENTMPHVRGVVHAAGLIAARSIGELEEEEYLHILEPKVEGAWNLHILTMDRTLDCFVMFSSASVLLGLSGQGSYVSANTFLDRLAAYRQQHDLPATSINWGVIKDVGMVANDDQLERYAAAEGYIPVTMKEALGVMGKAYFQLGSQIAIQRMDAERTQQYYPLLGKQQYFSPLLKENLPKKERGEASIVEEFAHITDTREKIEIIERYLINHVAKITKASSARINSGMTFKGLGIDSLMAVQLRNLLESTLSLKLSVTKFWEYPSIREYSEYLYSTLDSDDSTTVDGNEAGKGAGKWFVVPEPNPEAKMKLFCFHDAGGSASLYHDWEQKLKGTFELNIVELPGRGRRSEEAFYKDIKEFIKDFIPAFIEKIGDSPYLLFGHSMGGLLLFETVQALRKAGNRLPERIYTSSTPQLESYSRHDVDPEMSNEQLVSLFPHLGKINIPDEELREVLMETLRADLRLINSFSYVMNMPLELPITSLRGKDDLKVEEKDVINWKKETVQHFEYIERPGGHRYIEDDMEFLQDLLLQDYEYNDLNTKAMA